MKSNIIDQLHDAMDILKDYPGVNDIIDQKEAQHFFKALSKSDLALAPSFKDIDAAQIIAESVATVEEWFDIFLHLGGIFRVNYAKDFGEKGYIFEGGVYGDLASYNAGDDDHEDNLYFKFFPCNRARFDGKEGTWTEIYQAITEHLSSEKFTVPDLPKEADAK